LNDGRLEVKQKLLQRRVKWKRATSFYEAVVVKSKLCFFFPHSLARTVHAGLEVLSLL
jgi:hypothetical protein